MLYKKKREAFLYYGCVFLLQNLLTSVILSIILIEALHI